MLPQSLQSISKELEELESKLIQFVLTPNKPTNQVLEHIFASGGKRIRPAIFLLCSKLINYSGEHQYPIAAVCEYIHTASLLHDDVIDSSTLRRNKPTVNSIWGDETAVLSGDLIYSTACRLMVTTQSLELIDSFAECIRFMSESELFQLELLWKNKITQEQYERIVAGKTAVLFETSAKSPAYLNKSSKEIEQHLATYGKNIGYAFQIFDDCLDYTGEELHLGKPVAADLLEGKITLPLIFALNSAHSKTPKLNNLVSKIIETGVLPLKEKQELLQLVKETGGLATALQKAEFHVDQAREALSKISKLIDFSSEQQKAFQALNDLTFFILNRKN